MSVPKRFEVLRFLSGLLKVFAWINLVFAILSAIGAALFGGQLNTLLSATMGDGYSFLTGAGVIVAAVGLLLVGLFYFVLLYAFGEFLGLQLAIEENTRMSAALLLKMHQDTQPAAPAAAVYPGAFASEPEPYK